tara:strand:+ start:25192 stop:26562 length:1371 start_codon:yes stop_codon:yes gene_type:complete
MSKKNNKKFLKKRGGKYYLNAKGHGPNGTDLVKSLKTSSLEIAMARRDEMLSQAKTDQWSEVEKLSAAKSRGWASIGDLVRGYYAWADEARKIGKAPQPKTIRQNAQALLRIARVVEPTLPTINLETPIGGFRQQGDRAIDVIPAELDNFSTLLFTKDLATEFAKHKFKEGQESGKVKSNVQVTIGANLRQARSVIAQNAKGPISPREFYEERGIQLPACVFEFHKAHKAFHVSAPAYQRPPEELIDGTLRAGRALKETNPNLFLAFTLGYELGLRPGEASFAKWSWFKQRKNGDVEVTIQGDRLKVGEEGWEGPKHSTAERPGRTIAIKRAVFNDILPFFNQDDPGGFVIPLKTKTERYNLIEIELNGFMRGLGWTKEEGYQKASYELRKLRGSDYYAKLGAEQAKNFLGHASVVTTEQFYAALGKDRVKALEPERLPDALEEASLDSNLFSQVA